jgi:hypothetical protein
MVFHSTLKRNRFRMEREKVQHDKKEESLSPLRGLLSSTQFGPLRRSSDTFSIRCEAAPENRLKEKIRVFTTETKNQTVNKSSENGIVKQLNGGQGE